MRPSFISLSGVSVHTPGDSFVRLGTYVRPRFWQNPRQSPPKMAFPNHPQSSQQYSMLYSCPYIRSDTRSCLNVEPDALILPNSSWEDPSPQAEKPPLWNRLRWMSPGPAISRQESQLQYRCSMARPAIGPMIRSKACRLQRRMFTEGNTGCPWEAVQLRGRVGSRKTFPE